LCIEHPILPGELCCFHLEDFECGSRNLGSRDVPNLFHIEIEMHLLQLDFLKKQVSCFLRGVD